MSQSTGTTQPIDPRPVFADSVATARSVMATVTPANLSQPTPCPDFTVEGLSGHLLTVLRRVAALGNGDDPMAMPNSVTEVAPDGWLAAFDTQADAAVQAWADDAVLDRVMSLPWAQLPGRAMLMTYVPELTVHTWDLAQGTGAEVTWHQSTVDAALEASRQLLPPPPRGDIKLPNGMGIPFADPVEVPDSAPTVDRLLGWYGRQPAA